MFEFTHTFAHSEVAVPELISRISPMAVAVSLPAWLDLAAVIVGSLAGVGEASRRKLDAVGFVGLALICGLGGGLVRDIMMQRGGVYMLESPYAIPASVITGCLGFLCPHALSHVPGLLEWVDITAVALFAAVGTDKALVNGYLPASCVLMGIMTGVGGGMLRDVFLGDVQDLPALQPVRAVRHRRRGHLLVRRGQCGHQQGLGDAAVRRRYHRHAPLVPALQRDVARRRQPQPARQATGAPHRARGADHPTRLSPHEQDAPWRGNGQAHVGREVTPAR